MQKTDRRRRTGICLQPTRRNAQLLRCFDRASSLRSRPLRPLPLVATRRRPMFADDLAALHACGLLSCASGSQLTHRNRSICACVCEMFVDITRYSRRLTSEAPGEERKCVVRRRMHCSMWAVRRRRFIPGTHLVTSRLEDKAIRDERRRLSRTVGENGGSNIWIRSRTPYASKGETRALHPLHSRRPQIQNRIDRIIARNAPAQGALASTKKNKGCA